MTLASVREVSHSFGGSLLFDKVTVHIERACLLGRNGAGKSTLMPLIDAELKPDDGAVMRQRGSKIARLAQPGRCPCARLHRLRRSCQVRRRY